MPTGLISLDEASWRLEQSKISGAAFAELLLETAPLLFGVSPGKELPRLVDLSRVISFRAEAENLVIADNVRWRNIQLSWTQLCTALKNRGVRISWSWMSDITSETLERFARGYPSRPRLDDLGPRIYVPELMRSAQGTAPPPRRASAQWFTETGYKSLVPLSGNAPPGKRGPKSSKLENAAAAMRQDLDEKTLTVADLQAMIEKKLAARYQVSRDTARKARFVVLQSFVENSTSTNDK